MTTALSSNKIATVFELLHELNAGRMIILVDDEARENEGDLVLAADHVTAAHINFMAKYGRGLICLALTKERCDALNLTMMTAQDGHNKTAFGTNFTVSIEAATGVTTGISAADRARTIQVAIAKTTEAKDLVQPGHVFPLKAHPGGVLVRAGHTEAGCDLTRLAGLTPAAVICEIMKDDGNMARLPDLYEFSRQHHLKIGTIADLIRHRCQHESMIEAVGQRITHTAHGAFQSFVYRDIPTGNIHLALVKGEPQPETETLVRVHHPASLLDALETQSTAHSWTISAALSVLAQARAGVLVLLSCNQDAPQVLENFLTLPATQDLPPPPQALSIRTHGIGAHILRDLHVGKMRLLSQPWTQLPAMAAYGLEILGYLAPTPS